MRYTSAHVLRLPTTVRRCSSSSLFSTPAIFVPFLDAMNECKTVSRILEDRFLRTKRTEIPSLAHLVAVPLYDPTGATKIKVRRSNCSRTSNIDEEECETTRKTTGTCEDHFVSNNKEGAIQRENSTWLRNHLCQSGRMADDHNVSASCAVTNQVLLSGHVVEISGGYYGGGLQLAVPILRILILVGDDVGGGQVIPVHALVSQPFWVSKDQKIFEAQKDTPKHNRGQQNQKKKAITEKWKTKDVTEDGSKSIEIIEGEKQDSIKLVADVILEEKEKDSAAKPILVLAASKLEQYKSIAVGNVVVIVGQLRNEQKVAEDGVRWMYSFVQVGPPDSWEVSIRVVG